jgi:hypothetical protein
MHENTGALPLISSKQVMSSMSYLEENGSRMEMFATNTDDAMVGTVLRETLLCLRSALKSWVDRLEATENEIQHICSSMTDDETDTTRPLIFITGNEAEILTLLLKNPPLDVEPDPDLVWMSPPADSESRTDLFQIRQPSTGQMIVVELTHERYIVFYGLPPLLRKYGAMRNAALSQVEALRQDILGRRIAKNFGPPGIFYGHVTSIRRSSRTSLGCDLFMVRFDDGDDEEYHIVELHGRCYSFCQGNSVKGDFPVVIQSH